jgi:F-type H+-transporting ATPase subunit b
MVLLGSLISVEPGLIFWTTLIFLGLYALLTKAAWKPLQKALKDREVSIDDALQQAQKARSEMAALNAENEKLLAVAREERSRILQEAKVMSDNIVKDAKDKAKAEADKIANTARREIEMQKNAALAEIKGTVGALALEIAEQVIRKELSNDAAQQSFANKLVADIKLN